MVYPASSLECNVCANDFSEQQDMQPRTLPNCGHNNCKNCIDRLIEGAKKIDKDVFNCPLCRKETPVNAAFPVNILFLQQLEQSNKASDSQSIVAMQNESQQRQPMADRTNNLGEFVLKQRRRSQDDCYVPQNASPMQHMQNFSHAAAANIHSANVSPQEAMDSIDHYQNRNQGVRNSIQFGRGAFNGVNPFMMNQRPSELRFSAVSQERSHLYCDISRSYRKLFCYTCQNLHCQSCSNSQRCDAFELSPDDYCLISLTGKKEYDRFRLCEHKFAQLDFERIWNEKREVHSRNLEAMNQIRQAFISKLQEVNEQDQDFHAQNLHRELDTERPQNKVHQQLANQMSIPSRRDLVETFCRDSQNLMIQSEYQRVQASELLRADVVNQNSNCEAELQFYVQDQEEQKDEDDWHAVARQELEYLSQHMLETYREKMCQMSSFLYGNKRKALVNAQSCPAGYIWVRNAIKESKMLAFPKDGLKSGPCLLFNMNKQGTFKGFEIKVPEGLDFESSPEETTDRQVVFAFRLIVIAETLLIKINHEQARQQYCLFMIRVIGDQFVDQVQLHGWIPVQHYTLVNSARHIALVGGLDEQHEASKLIQVCDPTNLSKPASQSVGILQHGRIKPACTFDKANSSRLYIYGGTCAQGNLIHSFEMVDLKPNGEAQGPSNLFQINLAFQLKICPELSKFDLFVQAEGKGLCIVHTTNTFRMGQPLRNDLCADFFKNKDLQQVRFEAFMTDLVNEPEHLGIIGVASGVISKAKALVVDSNVETMVGFPLYCAAKDHFKFVALNKDSVSKGAYSMLNFKVGIKMVIGNTNYSNGQPRFLKEKPLTEDDEFRAKVRHLTRLFYPKE